MTTPIDDFPTDELEKPESAPAVASTASEAEARHRAWPARFRDESATLEVEYHATARGLVVVLARDGEVLVREWGGPIYHQGRRLRSIQPTVSVWRDRSMPSLRVRALQRLADAGFPRFEQLDLRHGEVPARVAVRYPGGDDLVWIPGRLRDAVPGLAALSGEIEKACSAICARAADAMPNPELLLWPEAERRSVELAARRGR